MLKYSFNFKPKFLNVVNTSNSIKTNSKLYCKNFIYFILFLEYFFRKNRIFTDYSVIVLKKISKLQPILRAPNKHKKAQVHLKLERFYCKLLFKYNFNLVHLNNANIIFFIKFFSSSIWFFESSLISLRMKRFNVSIPLKNICEL